MKWYTFSEKLPKLLKEAFQESGDANDAKMTYGKTQIIYIYIQNNRLWDEHK